MWGAFFSSRHSDAATSRFSVPYAPDPDGHACRHCLLIRSHPWYLFCVWIPYRLFSQLGSGHRWSQTRLASRPRISTFGSRIL
jgi:hypothetical protein